MIFCCCCCCCCCCAIQKLYRVLQSTTIRLHIHHHNSIYFSSLHNFLMFKDICKLPLKTYGLSHDFTVCTLPFYCYSLVFYRPIIYQIYLSNPLSWSSCVVIPYLHYFLPWVPLFPRKQLKYHNISALHPLPVWKIQIYNVWYHWYMYV